MAGRLLLSKIVGGSLVGPAGDHVGRVADCVVRLADAEGPLVTGIVLQVDQRDTFVPTEDLAALESGRVRLAVDKVGTRPFERRPGEVLLVRDVRGRGVVDVGAPRLVRVGDVVLEGEGVSWHVVAIVPAPAASLGKLVRRLVGQDGKGTEAIPWPRIEPLMGHVPSARQRISLPRLNALRPADIADIVEQASHEEGQEILQAVHEDQELEADVFEELADDHQLEFLRDRSDAEVAAVLGNMAADDAADLLMQLDQERRRPVLELLPVAQQRKVQLLLGYNPETAGGLMTPEFVALPEELSAGEALQRLRALGEVPETLTEVYSLAEERLSGSISLAQLIRSDPASRLADLVRSDPVAVHPDADIPSVALHMADYNLSALPVVDEASSLLGVITYDDIIEAMLPTEWRWRGRPGQAEIHRQGSSSST